MEQTPEFIQIVQNSVLEPDLGGAFWLLGVFFLSEAIAPLPSTLLFAGQLLFLDDPVSLVLVLKLLFLVAIPMALGTTLGSFILYGIAYWGGKPAIERFKRYLRFSWEDVEKFESKFKDRWYDDIIFVLLRATPLTPTIPLNIVAGVLRMNPVKYGLYTMLGLTIRMVAMLVIFGVGSESRFIDILNL